MKQFKHIQPQKSSLAWPALVRVILSLAMIIVFGLLVTACGGEQPAPTTEPDTVAPTDAPAPEEDAEAPA